MHSPPWILLLSLALGIPSAQAERFRAFPKRRPCAPNAPQVTNESIASYGTIDAIFRALGATSLADGTEANWANVLKQQNIVPCHSDAVAVVPAQRVPADSSGILSDTQNRGSRSFYQTRLQTCDGREIALNFTYDRIGDLCGFELFLKTADDRILGVALDKTGQVLETVPTALAFDKYDYRNRGTTDPARQTITSGVGCLTCHPRVSADFDSPGASAFWGDRLRPAPQPTGVQAPDAPNHSPPAP